MIYSNIVAKHLKQGLSFSLTHSVLQMKHNLEMKRQYMKESTGGGGRLRQEYFLRTTKSLKKKHDCV